MTLFSDLQALKDLANEISGFTAFDDPPDVISPGCAWPILVAVDWSEVLPIITWGVVFVVGNDNSVAMDFMDDITNEARQVFKSFMYVDDLIPYKLESVQLAAVVVRGRKEM